MSKRILDELYDCDLFHMTEIADVDDEYKSADIDLHSLSNRNEFHKGFRAGAQLVLEMIKPIK